VIVLGTHVLWWRDQGSPKLGSQSLALIQNAHLMQREVAVSAISFWEIALLIKKQRLSLSMSEWRLSLLAAGLVELPLQGGLYFYSDPF